MILMLQPTSMAQWHELIIRGEEEAGIHLSEELESYLVFLSMRLSVEPQWTQETLGLSYLDSLNKAGQGAAHPLRDVGDHCLAFAGWFPEQAQTRNVCDDYFIMIGQQAYHQLHLRPPHDRLFHDLAQEFPNLCQVLQASRACGTTQPQAIILEDASDEAANLPCYHPFV